MSTSFCKYALALRQGRNGVCHEITICLQREIQLLGKYFRHQQSAHLITRQVI